MKINRISLIIIMLTSLIIVSCGVLKSKEKAEKITIQFYDAIKKQDYKKALSFVGDKGREITPIEKWENLLKKLNKQMGKLQSYDIGAFGFNTSSNKGTTITLTISTVYAKSSWKERLLFFNPPNSEEITIIGYKPNFKKKE